MGSKNFFMLAAVAVSLMIFLLLGTVAYAEDGSSARKYIPHQSKTGDVVTISGFILDTHKEPVGEAEIIVKFNGHEVDRVTTTRNGKYISRFIIPRGEMSLSTIQLEVKKTSYKTQIISLRSDKALRGQGQFSILQDVILQRTLGPAFWVSTVIFILAYTLIAFELLHRTIAAMLGAGLMMLISYTIGTINPDYHIFSFNTAIASIDMNVIFLLMGMMMIVGVLKHTGVFQWCAYFAYKLAGGRVFLLSIYLMAFTAFASAFLDNVTTMLLLTGVAIEICASLSLNPLYMLIPLVLASNIGGTATLIGDPPNIMIGSYAGLTFVDFVVALAALCGVCMVALVIFTKLVWGKGYASAKVENVKEYVQQLKEEYRITDAKLLSYGLGVLAFAVLLFLTHGYWHMEVSIAALMGGAILVTIAVVTDKVNLIELIEKDIEWPTLMFFIFLFIIVGAVESTGLLSLIADWILKLSQGNFVAALSLILWVAAIVSAFVDNIPFTATMLPIVAYLSSVIPGSANTLWWALAIGACFGGNGTIIGASANVVTMGIAESRGYRITFGGFMKTAFPYMLISVGIAQLWLLMFRPQ